MSCLPTMHKQSISVGYSIENTMLTLEGNGEAFSRSTARLLENLSDLYAGILVPCFALQDKEIALAGYSVVNGTKSIAHIPIEESVGINILKTDKAKSLFLVPYQGVDFTVETNLTKRKITPYYQDGVISFVFSLSFKATVEFGNKRTPYNLTDAALKEMEASIEQIIEAQLSIAMDQAKNVYKTDYLQMDDAFRIKYPVLYETLNWQDAFQKVNTYWKIKVSLGISSSLDYGPNQPR